MGLARRYALLVMLVAAGCADPVMPRSGVVTLDEPVSAPEFTFVSAGREHSCALGVNSRAFCWGSNEFGQLGVPDDGTTCQRGDRRIPCRLGPTAVAGGISFVVVRAGGDHSCGIAVDGRIHCWGDNLHGQLGDPAVRGSAEPIAVNGNAQFMDLATGDEHSCGLRTDGVLLCWGANDRGQLGVSLLGTGAAVPTQTQTTQRFIGVSASQARTCALSTDGSAFCWGALWVSTNSSGADITRFQASPQRVQQAPAFRAISVGSSTTCGIGNLGGAFCWESNRVGSIGDGTRAGSTVPKAVETALHFVTISAGGAHTCAIAEAGDAYCWGKGSAGQLGVSPGTFSSRCGMVACKTTPVRVSGWRKFSQISAGLGDHTCALSIGGHIYCWGAGGMGQRGIGVRASDWVPVKTVGPATVVTTVTAGASFRH